MAKIYRYIFSSLLILLSLIGKGQTVDGKLYTNFSNWYQWSGGKFINNLNIPKLTATSGRDTGGIRYALADSSVYVWTGSQWRAVGGGAIPTLQQVTTAGNITTDSIISRGFIIDGVSSDFSIAEDGVGSGRIALKNRNGTYSLVRLGNQLSFINSAGNATTILKSTTAATYTTTLPDTTGNLSVGVAANGTTYMAGTNGITNIGNTDTATVVKAYVTNAEAVTITKGQVVYIFGAQGDRASVKLAKNTSDTFSSKTLGIVRADIAAGQAGWITTQGQVGGINLGAYTAGDVLWLDSVPGGFTATKPQAPYHAVFVGVVERANAGNGLIYVKPQNGVELDELHDVRITSLANNEIIRYNSSLGYWENKSITTTLGYTPLNVTDTTAMLSPYLRKVDTLSLSNRINAISGGSAIAWDAADSLYSSAQLKKGTFRTYDFDGTSAAAGIPQGSGDVIYMTQISASGTFLNIRDNNINGIQLSTGGSAGSSPYLSNGYANNVNVTYDLTGSNIKSTWMHFRVRIPTLNDGTQRFYTFIGWKSVATANPTESAYFTYDLDGTQTGSTASANWQTVSAFGGNREWTTTSSAVPTNTWQTLSIRATTSAVQFYIDGTLVSTHTTRIPVAGRIYIQIFKTNGTTARFLDVDYATFNQLNQSDR